MATKNEEIVTALQQLVPFGRVQWGLTYVVPAALRDDIIAALTAGNKAAAVEAEADKPRRGRPPKVSAPEPVESPEVGDTIRGKEPE